MTRERLSGVFVDQLVEQEAVRRDRSNRAFEIAARSRSAERSGGMRLCNM
jgi:hypothetical protein